MKGQDLFVAAIQRYITEESARDSRWGEKVKESKKDAEACAKYIIAEVKKTKRNGFADDEVFGMVKHFYDEGCAVPTGWSGCSRVVGNVHTEITEEEKESIRKKVEDEYRKEVEEREKEKELKKKKKEEEEKEKKKERERKEKAAQLDLFGF